MLKVFFTVFTASKINFMLYLLCYIKMEDCKTKSIEIGCMSLQVTVNIQNEHGWSQHFFFFIFSRWYLYSEGEKSVPTKASNRLFGINSSSSFGFFFFSSFDELTDDVKRLYQKHMSVSCQFDFISPRCKIRSEENWKCKNAKCSRRNWHETNSGFGQPKNLRFFF